MYLIQYLPYAITLLFLLLPAVLLGFQQRSLNFYGLSGSCLILLIVFGSRPRQLFYFLGSFFLSVLLIRAALLLRKRERSGVWIFLPFFFAAFLPVLLKNFVLIPGQQLPLYGAEVCLSLKTIQILVYIYRDRIREYPTGECAGFLLFFPSLFLGPLDNCLEFHRSWTCAPSVKEYRRILGKGLKEILLGIFYLLFIAHILSIFLQELESRILEGSALWYLLFLYSILYGSRLFFFLAGCSRIAAGCSCLLGVGSKENFRKPFFCTDIQDFWDRWQITFTCWLKDFIFCPFIKKFKKSRQFSCPLLGKCLGYLLTMGALGIFYGFKPSSLLFALYHGLLLCLLELWKKKIPFYKKWKDKSVYRFFSWLLTLFLLFFGFFLLSGMFLKLFSL